MISNEAEKNRTEDGIDEYDDNTDATIYNSPRKTPFDGVKKLWSEVLLLAVEYAKGEITNDHDCGGNPEIREKFRRSSIRFLNCAGTLKLACEATGQDINNVIRFGQRYKHIIENSGAH